MFLNMGQTARNFMVVLFIGIVGSTFAQSAHAHESLCPAGHQDRGGLAGELCYELCKPGFDGIATTCWQSCPQGLSDVGLFCSDAGNVKVVGKSSYGRGAGKPLQCASGQEQDGALCYPPCKAGYNGIGPVCWGRCPEGTDTDFGATCTKWPVWGTRKVWFARIPYIKDWGWTKFKPSYGRGAGVPLSSCKAGQEKDGALCYPACKAGYNGIGPVCWGDCPSGDGWHDDGALCRFDRGFLKSSYDRGVGLVPSGQSHSFRNAYVADTNNDFSIVVMSDPQFSWSWKSEGKQPNDPSKLAPNDGDVVAASMTYNNRMVESINKLRQTSKIEFLVMNGDLTDFGRAADISRYQSFYNQHFKHARDNAVQLPVYIGLGNHDYENNYGECTNNVTLQWNRCSNDMINLIRGSVFKKYTGDAMYKDNLESFDESSLSYSWNKGKFHFIQIHDYPDTRNSNVESPLAWLDNDLSLAQQRGQVVIINMHEYNPGENDSKDLELRKLDSLLGKYKNIVAIYSGHLHQSFGRHGAVGPNDIPHYRSGSAINQTYLRVDFTANSITTRVYDARNTELNSGTPEVVNLDRQ